MELFVLRHGHAEAEASSDSLRPLSATGAKEVAEIYSKCSDSLANVELILVSPYVRAQQTLSTLTALSPHLQNVPQQTTTLLVLWGKLYGDYRLFIYSGDGMLCRVYFISKPPTFSRHISG